MEELPLIDQDLLLERFPGKGGWTYVRFPDIEAGKYNYFSWQKVKGFIDGYEINKATLMPMKKGVLFLPVKAAIRKEIKKQEGEHVRVCLYPDSDPKLEIANEDFIDCLKDEPAAWAAFKKLPASKQEECFTWLLDSPVLQTRIQRMADAITNLASGLPFHSSKR
ncbi:YdeI/OmpD-associated family protein [Pedobacter gandavensis]|uniref:YdeI/OmpD-associated family protein n=1 Tax=Pedobacter gandavensis TaxID=2679963 RepID=UPI00292F5762|nr:YdeI/OmpD-associated family protein [Pedobacter gandavensis]